jgi:hypothetical protein
LCVIAFRAQISHSDHGDTNRVVEAPQHSTCSYFRVNGSCSGHIIGYEQHF